jgi:hypothetical protein
MPAPTRMAPCVRDPRCWAVVAAAVRKRTAPQSVRSEHQSDELGQRDAVCSKTSERVCVLRTEPTSSVQPRNKKKRPQRARERAASLASLIDRCGSCCFVCEASRTSGGKDLPGELTRGGKKKKTFRQRGTGFIACLETSEAGTRRTSSNAASEKVHSAAAPAAADFWVESLSVLFVKDRSGLDEAAVVVLAVASGVGVGVGVGGGGPVRRAPRGNGDEMPWFDRGHRMARKGGVSSVWGTTNPTTTTARPLRNAEDRPGADRANGNRSTSGASACPSRRSSRWTRCGSCRRRLGTCSCSILWKPGERNDDYSRF